MIEIDQAIYDALFAEFLLSYLRSAMLEESMAERKSARRRAPERVELQKRLDIAKTVVMSEDEIKEQRASFAFGNAPRGSRITKASALSATKSTRMTSLQTTDAKS